MNGSQPTYEFGPFALDADKRLLLRDGVPVPLAPKALETLLALIEYRDRVVTKDELLQRIWGDTVVEEGGLTRNISILRKALGEKPDDHHYVVTVPGRGYRFVADVRERARGAEPADAASKKRSARAAPTVTLSDISQRSRFSELRMSFLLTRRTWLPLPIVAGTPVATRWRASGVGGRRARLRVTPHAGRKRRTTIDCGDRRAATRQPVWRSVAGVLR